MNQNLVVAVFVLDRSGSMSGLESDTIGGFNSMLNQQKDENTKVLVSTVLFDTKVEVLHDRMDIHDVKPLTEKDYYVRGCTALLDAVGRSIKHISRIHKYAREEDRPRKTMFVIITDGYENSSQEYTYKAVKKMISKEQEKYGWDFIFLGADIDVAKEAESLGIRAERAIKYKKSHRGVEKNFEVMACCMNAIVKENVKPYGIDEMLREKYSETRE